MRAVLAIRINELTPPPAYPIPPIPPSPYALPSNPVYATNGTTLQAALNSSTPADIVLRDGTYAKSSAFTFGASHRVYSENLGGALLTAGVDFNRPNIRLQGLRFAIASAAATTGSVINAHSSATNLTALDLDIDGGAVCSSGIDSSNPEGIRVERIVATRFIRWGITLDNNERVWPPVPLTNRGVANDLNISEVVDPSGTSNGRWEFGVWLGNSINGTRWRVTRCSWSGLWFGTAFCGTPSDYLHISHVDVDNPYGHQKVIYPERYTRYWRLTDSLIGHGGPNDETGVNCEWNHGSGAAAANDFIIDNCTINTRNYGVFYDEGSNHNACTNTKFIGQTRYGIFSQRAIQSPYDTSGNDYSQLGSGGHPIGSV